jgi:hypothetical protein
VGPGQPVNPDDDPLNAFARLFGGVGDGADADLEKRRKKSVLDAALGDLDALRTRLGQTERARLDLHLDALREVEARIVNNAAATCGQGFDPRGFAVSPTDYYPLTFHKEENFRLVGELQMDLAVLALACGATRVVSLMWSHPVSPTRIHETGVTTGNHDASHYGSEDSALASDFVKLKRWLMERFVYLIDKLQRTPEEGGSLLDHTLVLLCSELGDSDDHDHKSVPFVLAGRAGGALRTGRYLNYTNKNAGENEPHTKLLVSIARALDVDIDRFGYTGHGTGPLSGL